MEESMESCSLDLNKAHAEQNDGKSDKCNSNVHFNVSLDVNSHKAHKHHSNEYAAKSVHANKSNYSASSLLKRHLRLYSEVNKLAKLNKFLKARVNKNQEVCRHLNAQVRKVRKVYKRMKFYRNKHHKNHWRNNKYKNENRNNY